MAPNDRPSKPLPKDKEKRRRELERLKYERQTQKRAAAVRRARKRTAVVGAAVVAVAAVGGGAWALSSSGAKKSTAAATPSASVSASGSAKPAAAHVAGCTTAAPGAPTSQKWTTEPAMAIDTAATYNATITTNCGAITLKLNAAKAPHTVNSFVFLAGQHFFDHVKCHRLTSGGLSVLQCGDPTGTGSGGPGYQFKDENLTDPTIKGGTYPAGTVAMANAGANTNGSQFFLVYKDSQLPASYTPFGTITGGLDILQKIAAAGSDNANGQGDGAPRQSVVMNTVTAVKG